MKIERLSRTFYTSYVVDRVAEVASVLRITVRDLRNGVAQEITVEALGRIIACLSEAKAIIEGKEPGAPLAAESDEQ